MHRAAGGTIHRLNPGLAMVRLRSRKPEMPPDAPACAAVIVISFLLQIFYYQQQRFLPYVYGAHCFTPRASDPVTFRSSRASAHRSPKTRRSRLLNHTFGFDRSALGNP